MANPLTGDYEAAVQIATRQINGLLGTLHQNGANPDTAVLKLLHSVNFRIGDPRRRPPDVQVFGDWLIQYQKRAGRGRGMKDVRAELAATAPPGAAKLLSDAFAGFDRDWVIEIPPDVVRGLGKIQIGSITISVPGGSSTEVMLHAPIRAHYYPDSGTTALPAPIHGEMRAAFEVRRVPFASRTRLTIQPTAQDAKIQFIAAPGSGLSAADASNIAAQVRKVLRESLGLVPVDLPAGFAFTEFKGLGSGQVIALPLQLSSAPAPASGVSGLTQSFIGSSGFAFAVSKDYVAGRFDLEAIRESIRNRPPLRIGLDLGWFGEYTLVTYSMRFSEGPTLTFKSGGIEISGKVEVETDTFVAPNGWVRFRAQVALVLDTAAQTVRLMRVGEPHVETEFPPRHNMGLNIVRSEIDKALSANTSRVQGVFNNAKNRLTSAMRTFDPSSTVSFTGIEVNPNGVVVRGEIGSGARRVPVVDIAETHGGAAFTAFKSWIPAGRIDRFIWSWIEHSELHPTPWGGIAKSLTDEHRFILPKPEGITQISQVCLRIEGARIAPNGNEFNIAAGTTCSVPEPEVLFNAPSWWEPVTIPIWRPDAAAASSMREAIAGHVSVQSDAPESQSSSQNTLVYFADWRSQKPLEALSTALGRLRNKAALMVMVVLPAGAFDMSRREFEARLPKDIGAKAQFTEDNDGGWTRMFGVTKTPSAYLVNARREFVWKQEGEPDPAALSAALDKYLVPTQAAGFRPLRLAVLPGDVAPDAIFADDQKDQFALHRYRGRNMLLNFWQSWSAPCLTELSRLQQLHQAGKGAPFIVAFHGGKDGKALDEIRKRLKLTLPLVQDSQQRIARQYGVRCWPTTILVDADGEVEHIQFGTEHEHDKPRDKEQPAPAKSPGMITLSVTLLAVLASDQAMKFLLRRTLGSEPIPLGPFGSMRMVSGQLWIGRFGGLSSPSMMWLFWMVSAAALVIVSTRFPSSQVFVGLLLGGSLSNALEKSLRGSVSDYVCLRFWPTFNLADLALTVGAIGTLATLLIAVWNGVT